jgi:hypothetical protein
MVRASASGRYAASTLVVAAIIAHQPAAPSAAASVSTTSTIAAGCSSGPPRSFGTHIPKKPASAKADTSSAGSRRPRSVSSARALMRGARARAACRRSDGKVGSDYRIGRRGTSAAGAT